MAVTTARVRIQRSGGSCGPDWLKSHARQILAAVVLLAGAYMVISGLARLG